MNIKQLKTGMILDSIYNDCFKKDSKWRYSKILKYVGKNIVVYSYKEDGKEWVANDGDILAWSGYKIRRS